VVAGRVLGGGSLNEAMGEVRVSGALRAAVQDLAYSALRDFGRADAVLANLMESRPAASLHGLLLAAVTELSRHPRRPYVVVDQAVEAAARVAPRDAGRAKGLVNAVLRNFLRRRDTLTAAALLKESGKYRHPQWWINRIRTAWPGDWKRVLEAANSPPPMILRVNARRMSGNAYMAVLAERTIGARLLGPQAVCLHRPMPVDRLPGFSAGDVSVQDLGAQQAATLLDLRSGMRVLDACAAPGGKTAHIAEIADCVLTAADSDPKRLTRVSAALNRLSLQADIVRDDALHPAALLKGAPYERILADVPCSASGVVRRHPDIKWLRREADIARFVEMQDCMLASLWRLLAPGGKLLYATCSVFPQENADRIAVFLDRHKDARRLPLDIDPDVASPLEGAWCDGAQLLPGVDNDGFFYALLGKKR
jgi:16S rRNA (cytosine967-C5)-methyltransferase